ncbi:fumarylacetoacetate hydrolase family protein [Bartonella sp. DGB1]|uniref:fumarylacetoacetate hydrolase family protein n=1 Tax=Bartonella sp. DGB1 TaxID=3239807 RepID=UPI00352570A7
MKLLRYGAKGQELPAILDNNGNIRDLSAYIKDIAGDILLPENLEKLKKIDITRLPLVPNDVRIGACVGNVGKFICIGLNYVAHASETSCKVPEEPVVFNKWTSAIIGPNDNIEIPINSTKTDWEVELGVVIGKGGKYIEQKDALTHVAGYCVINDVSERDYQLNRCGSWDKGKGCDTFGPIGPWLVTKDEIADVHDLNLWLEVDGKRYQDSNTKAMVFTVDYLISYLSQFMSLQPGDVIATGTPPGVGLGLNPPVFLKAGQKIKLAIDGLGEQNQLVVNAKK